MPVPSLITDLNPDPNLNSPVGSEPVFPLLDDYMRHFAAFIRQIYDGPILQTALPDGILSADAAGRAKMADLFVTLAKLSQDVQNGIAKTGDFKWRFGTSPGDGWKVVNGATLSRTTDSRLWAFAQASGNLAASEGTKQRGQFGPGDGSTTFTLPNLLAGDFISAAGTGLAIGTWRDSQNKAHVHGAVGEPVPPHTHGIRVGDTQIDTSGPSRVDGHTRAYVGNDTEPAGGHTPVVTIQSSGGTDAFPKNIALLPCIKD